MADMMPTDEEVPQAFRCRECGRRREDLEPGEAVHPYYPPTCGLCHDGKAESECERLVNALGVWDG